MPGCFTPVLANTISWASGVGWVRQKSRLASHTRFALAMASIPWAAGERVGTCFSV